MRKLCLPQSSTRQRCSRRHSSLQVRSPPLTAMGDASLMSVDGALEGHGRAPSFSLAQHNLDDMADPIDSALYVPFFSLCDFS
jgi:hypothetical protein